MRQDYAQAHAAIVAALQATEAALLEWQAMRLTTLGLRCGQRLLAIFQQIKARRGALDFTDLEWQAHRLLRDPDLAAYMQTWLDARYRQLLLDEFQDTNPLQWQVLQSWLGSYEADAAPACCWRCRASSIWSWVTSPLSISISAPSLSRPACACDGG